MTEVIMETKDINELLDIVIQANNKTEGIVENIQIILATISEHNQSIAMLIRRIEEMEQQTKSLRITSMFN